MKKLFQFLVLLVLSTNVYSQTYNISIQGSSGTYVDTIPKGQTFAINTYIKNNSTAPVGNLTFRWYISTDAVYSTNDTQIDELIVFRSGSSADMPLEAGRYANVNSVFAVIPNSYPTGCNFYLITRITSAYNETNYADNVSAIPICVREKRLDLSASVSLSSITFFKGLNNKEVVVNERIVNDGELASAINTNYVVKVGTSPDHTVGNLITKPQVHQPTIGAYGTASLIDTFDISTLPNDDYYVFLIIDPDNLINEPKKNNIAMSRFRIADLVETSGEVNVPKLDSIRYIKTCNSVIYDDGGLLGDYSPNGSSVLFVYPSVNNARVRLTVKSSALADTKDYFTLGYVTAFGGTGQTQSSTSTKLIEDYLSYNSEGIASIQFKSDTSKQAAGFVIEAKCSYGNDYKVMNLMPLKPNFINKVDSVSFSFDLKNVGFTNIAGLSYQYGLTREPTLSQPLFKSSINTSGAIPYNDNSSKPFAKIVNNKIPLTNLSVKDTGTYYIYVKVGVGQNDVDTTDNLIFYPIKIVSIDTLNNTSVNFKNNTTKYISTCNLTLYDDGGPTGNYSNNFNGKVYLYPSEPDKIIKITASNVYSNLEKNSNFSSYLDVLSINNVNTDAVAFPVPLANEFTYIASTLPMKAAMVKFVSNATTNLAGFQLNVTCAQNRRDYIVERFDMTSKVAVMGVEKSLAYTIRFNNNGNSANPIQQSPWLLYVSPTKNINDAIYISAPRIRNFSDYNSTTDTISLKNITKAGKYYFIAFLDPANIYSEVDRINNVSIDSVDIWMDHPNRIPVVGSKTIVSCNDTITDHSVLGSNYENNSSGILTINPPTGQRVKVSFLTFDTEANNDYLDVYDGISTSATRIGRFSGNTLPVDIVSTNATGSLTFSFVTNGTVTRSGISFKTICEQFNNLNMPVTGNQVVKTCAGVVYDNGGANGSFSNNANGSVTIVPNVEGKYISLDFRQLDLYNDFLEVYDGENMNATLLTAFTSQNYSLPIVVKASNKNPTGALTLRFKTDASLFSNGFTTWISCVNNPAKEILFPYAGKRNMVSCGDTIFDNGGSAENGASPSIGIITLKPRNASEKVRFNFVENPSFTFNSDFSIYDGDSTNAPLIASSKTSTIKTVLATNPSGSLTISYTNRVLFNKSDNFKFVTSCFTPTIVVLPVSKDTTVYGCNQFIYDNGGKDGVYSSGLNQSVTIYPDVNTKKIKLETKQMDIHPTDTLFVFDGSSVNSKLIGKFNGTQFLPVIVSSNENKSGALTIKLVSDNSITSEGFSFFASCVDSVVGLSVPFYGNRTVSACSGNVVDIIGDYGDYYNNSDGSLTIKPLKQNHRVQLTLNSYDLESSKDFIYVYDGNSVDSKLIGTYTGKNTTIPFLISTSEDGSLTVRFVSNSSVTKPGFRLSVSCLLPSYTFPAKGTRTITGCEGSILDDGGSANYKNNSDGTMVVYPEIEGRMARVFFNTFNLQSMDTLSIYNGNSISAPLIGRYTGTTVSAATANNSSGALTLRFKSDATGTNSGFISTISCVLVTGEQEFYNELEEQFLLVPNPAQHYIKVNKLGKNDVYNVAGVLVLTTENQEINISNFPSGIYRLVNTLDGKTRSKSFIKN
jgi:hypothetical protein